jgi:hypothetical protein
VIVEAGTAMRPEDAAQIRSAIDARRDAREARRALRLEKSIADRREEYAER